MTDLELLECAWLAPYDTDNARANSCYCAPHDGELIRLLETAPPSAFARVSHDGRNSGGCISSIGDITIGILQTH